MQLIGALLIIIGIIDFGLSWIGIDLTSQFVGTFSPYTPYLFLVYSGVYYIRSGKKEKKNNKLIQRVTILLLRIILQ